MPMFAVPEPVMGMEPPTPLTKSFLEDLVNDENMERFSILIVLSFVISILSFTVTGFFAFYVCTDGL